MKHLLEKIDKYLSVQEKKDRIYLSLDSLEIEVLIEMIKKSSDRENILSLLDENKRKEIQKLIDGGIL